MPTNIFIANVMFFVRWYVTKTKNIFIYYFNRYFPHVMYCRRGMWLLQKYTTRRMWENVEIFVKTPKGRRMLLIMIVGIYIFRTSSSNIFLRIISNFLKLLIIARISYSMYIFIHLKNPLRKNHPKNRRFILALKKYKEVITYLMFLILRIISAVFYPEEFHFSL